MARECATCYCSGMEMKARQDGKQHDCISNDCRLQLRDALINKITFFRLLVNFSKQGLDLFFVNL